MSGFQSPRPQMNYFPHTLNEIAEDRDEWAPEQHDTPPKGEKIRSVKSQVKPMAMPRIKDHPVAMPGVDDQIKTSKVKHTRRSTV